MQGTFINIINEVSFDLILSLKRQKQAQKQAGLSEVANKQLVALQIRERVVVFYQETSL